MILRYILLLVSFVGCLSAHANVQVQANMDSIQILIGSQAHMTVDVTAKKGASVVFPEYKRSQYIVPGVEVLSSTSADTTRIDNDMVRVRKIFTLTSFDENVYPIPGMKVKVDGKSYQANQLALKVLTVDVDTLHPNQIYPPKDVQENPFQWSEWRSVFWLSVLLLLLGLGTFYLLSRLHENKPIVTHIRIVRRIPPHQKALSAIEKIKQEHMQTSEDQKTYYTQLTDTIRQYIRERFGFNAMEMTSSEIIDRLRQNGDEKMIEELRGLLQTADLVKFAKYSTLINENDLNLVNAVHFIDETKIEGQPIEERITPKLSEKDLKVRQSRLTIKALLYGIVAIATAIAIYIVYHIYQLVG